MRIIVPIEIDDTNLTESTVPEDEPLHDPAYTYQVGERARVGQRIFESKTTDNLDNTPPNTDHWIDAGASNRYRMFDLKQSSQTVVNGSITVRITPGAAVTGAALFNVQGHSVRLQIEVPGAGIVFDQTQQQLDTSNVIDWLSFYSAQSVRRKKASFYPLPVFINATYIITIDAGDGEAGCGHVVMGISEFIGNLQFGYSKSFADFSRKKEDQFGNKSFKKGDTADNLQVVVRVDNNRLDFVDTFMQEIASQPVAVIGNASRQITYIFGITTDYRMLVPDPVRSTVSFTAEGLT